MRSKFIVKSNFFFLKYRFSFQHSSLKYQYFIEATTIDIGMLLQVYLQFCNNSGLIAISDIMFFAYYWTLE